MIRTLTVEHDGVTYIGEIARIESTMLGYEDHGIFTAVIHFAGPSWAQGTPGYAIAEGNGIGFIRAVLNAVGVDQWEKLKGQRAIALREKPFDLIRGIANVDDDHAFVFADYPDRLVLA